MTNSKLTKKALLTSVMSLFLCVAMLMGTTYAWFTDEATSSGNKIVAGTLDVKLLMDVEGAGYEEIGSTGTPIFGGDDSLIAQNVNADTLWEPGKTQVAYLAIQNAGNLDLKYTVAVEVKGVTAALNEVMEYMIIPNVKFGEVTAWNGPGETVISGVNPTEASDVTLKATEGTTEADKLANATHYFALALHMLEDAGNEYMGGTIEFDIKVIATQLNSEYDSLGNDYDIDSKYVTSVETMASFFHAIVNGEDINLKAPLVVNEEFVDYANEQFPTLFALGGDTTVVDKDAVIDGNGITVYRTEEMADKPIITIADGYTLTLANITIDGGADWTGAIDATLLRGTTNSGMTTSGALVALGKASHLILEEGAILQNNDGANAVNLNTRAGSTLTINGGEILNNHSAAGAIWGGGEITINSGKVNGNHGGIGGAIRVVTNIGTVLTMNGGEMNHNKSDDVGGAIWAGAGRSNNVYVLNGGEMAYNYSPVGGGAIYAGYYETVKIGGTFKMYGNESPFAPAIRFHDHASLVMTGGEIDNGDNSMFLYNNSASITGGTIYGTLGYSGGLGLTVGEADIEGVIEYNLGTNHHTAYLAASFNGFEYKVNPDHVSNFNFKPADGYTYTEGDEDKLVCLNEGYVTYWDTATGTFRLQASN